MAKRRKRRVKGRHYKQLSVFDRTRIGTKYKDGMHVSDIAKLIKRDRSTVIREIARNSSGMTLGYRPESAQKKAWARREKQGIRPLLKSNLVRDYVTRKMQDGWSPEQIQLRLPIDHPGHAISYEAIYQFVYSRVNPSGTTKKGEVDLRPHLARRHKRRQKKGFRQTQKMYRPQLPCIEDRPKEVDKRKELGHWEDDTMVSRESRSRLKTINERVSGIVFIGKMKDGTIAESNRVVLEKLSPVPTHLRKTLTRDRGVENFGYADIEKELHMTCWFAHAFCSQERGSNENLNGLIRRILPKKTNFADVSDAEIQRIEHLLNSRPRKRHGGKTPYEVFYERTGCALAP